VFDERIETLVRMMLADPEVRLPGARRAALAETAAAGGIEVAQPLLDQLQKLAQ
jgi:(2R)-3-sulfolactate dehydrogenase (NADP+)